MLSSVNNQAAQAYRYLLTQACLSIEKRGAAWFFASQEREARKRQVEQETDKVRDSRAWYPTFTICTSTDLNPSSGLASSGPAVHPGPWFLPFLAPSRLNLKISFSVSQGLCRRRRGRLNQRLLK